MKNRLILTLLLSVTLAAAPAVTYAEQQTEASEEAETKDTKEAEDDETKNADVTTIRYEYDDAGNLTKEVHLEEGTYLLYEYDQNGNVTKESNFLGEAGETDLETYALDFWREYEYNEENQLLVQRNCLADGGQAKLGTVRTENEYDEQKNLIRSTYYKTEDEVEMIVEFDYDEEGRRIRGTMYDANHECTNYSEYEYAEDGSYTVKPYAADGTYTGNYSMYDSEDRIVRWPVYAQAGGYEYNEHGNPDTVVIYDADGNETNRYKCNDYVYDENDRITHKTTYKSTGKVSSEVDYEYAEDGKLVLETHTKYNS